MIEAIDSVEYQHSETDSVNCSKSVLLDVGFKHGYFYSDVLSLENLNYPNCLQESSK